MADPRPKRTDLINGYRAGETLPKKLNVAKIIEMAQTAYMAKSLGMPDVGVDQLVNKILVEGREDAGTNHANINNKQAEKLISTLRALGSTPESADYAAAVLDKSQVAKRLNIPFERAWNGTGRSQMTGRTGAQHAARAKQHEIAQDDPRNAELVDLVRRAGEANLTELESMSIVPYGLPGSLRERYEMETPLRDDWRIPSETRREAREAFNRALFATKTAYGYAGGKPTGVSPVWLSQLLEAKARKEKGEESLTTRDYERIMMERPDIASTVGTIAARTGKDAAPVDYKPPTYSTSNDSLLDKIRSFFVE